MIPYLARRLGYGLLLLLFISVVAFVLIQIPPGDWLTSYVAQLRAQGAQIDDAVIAGLRQQYGLGESLIVQYLKWMAGIASGNFGFSFSYNRPVTDLVLERLPITLLISGSAIFLTYALAIPIGVLSATRQYSFFDYLATFIGFIGLSVPSFLIALILMFLAYRYFGLSVGGLNAPQYIGEPLSWGKFWDFLAHLPLPIFIIAFSGMAPLIRILRGSLLDELERPYVDTARAKGLRERAVLLKYPVRVALNPIISTAGWLIPAVFSGQVIVSIVMNIPDMGPLLYQALLRQDTYLAGSVVLILSALTILGTLLSDVALALLDPRIRLEK
ncbi:peptide ABC transporter permease (plasmid) [Deinococcus aetherius]|uniref:Peptide ABC transporter permease n=1 Tax=Deinococcus aetherius TaxID=200252 RepID=A0ABM8AIT8_9DEIO|nr:ABC transporter permease [Deinococcus aetherius]BDP43706.1 peptide ABC transporter permease [Deinococcus aetherius]